MKLPRFRTINRNEWILQACKGKRVLHLGCTDWPLTAARVQKGQLLHAAVAGVASEVVGLDTDAEGIQTLSSLMPGKSFIVHSAEHLETCDALRDQHFDVILAADVLEHLSNPGLFLRSVRSILKPETSLLITTPQAYSLKRFIGALMLGREHVHSDHIAYFSLSTLSRLMLRHDLRIEEALMFQWRDRTFRNRMSNAIVTPLVWLTGARLADEIALVVKLS